MDSLINDFMTQLINTIKNDYTWALHFIEIFVLLFVKVDHIISVFLFLKRKFEDFLLVCQFIVTICKYCARCIKYIIQKGRIFKARITRRSIQLEQEQIDENNNVEDSASPLQLETPRTSNGASRCSMRNNDVVILIDHFIQEDCREETQL